jgi:hypothetical protein
VVTYDPGGLIIRHDARSRFVSAQGGEVEDLRDVAKMIRRR